MFILEQTINITHVRPMYTAVSCVLYGLKLRQRDGENVEEERVRVWSRC
jgi:hypothetical protein